MKKDFVFAGQRFIKGKLYAVLYVVENGKIDLGNAQAYTPSKSKLGSRKVGGVYRGAEFEDSSAIGLNNIAWTGQWENESLIAKWEAEDLSARTAARTQTMATKMREDTFLARNTTALRRQYETLRTETDRFAFEQALLLTLRKG